MSRFSLFQRHWSDGSTTFILAGIACFFGGVLAALATYVLDFLLNQLGVQTATTIRGSFIFWGFMALICPWLAGMISRTPLQLQDEKDELERQKQIARYKPPKPNQPT